MRPARLLGSGLSAAAIAATPGSGISPTNSSRRCLGPPWARLAQVLARLRLRAAFRTDAARGRPMTAPALSSSLDEPECLMLHTAHGSSRTVPQREVRTHEMSRGPSGRIVVEVDPALKKRLHAALTLDGITLKDWFRQRAETYLTGHQGL